MAKILGIGNALVDIMTSLEDDILLTELKLPKGSMQLVDINTSSVVLDASAHLRRQLTAGGSASNTIYGLAMLGVDTAFIGKIGKDEYGNVYKNDLLACKIIPRLYVSDTHSGRAVAFVSTDSERTFATHLGAAIELVAEDLVPDHFSGYQYLHIEGYLVQNYLLIRRAIDLAGRYGLRVSLDLASYNVVEEHVEFLKKLIRESIDIVFANEDEARALTGKPPEEAVEEISGFCEIAVVKTGPGGSLVRRGDEFHRIGIIPASPLDTTGAGDLYASGFLFGLIRGYDLKQSGDLGALLAGNIIEVLGARMDKQRWDRIREGVRRIGGMGGETDVIQMSSG
ncbi:MAG: adenosine kinase [Bacteroidales bacterium]